MGPDPPAGPQWVSRLGPLEKHALAYDGYAGGRLSLEPARGLPITKSTQGSRPSEQRRPVSANVNSDEDES